MGTTRLVRTRQVTLTSLEGKRLSKPVWGKAKLWKRARGILLNLKLAIAYAHKALEKRIGTVVYVGDVPVYHTKFGGGKAFAGWRKNPVAEYWRRKV